jgi:hypothetical protein
MPSYPAITALGISAIALLSTSCKDSKPPAGDASTEVASAESVTVEEVSAQKSSPEIAAEKDASKKSENASIEEELRKAENLQEFAYADFGPPLITQDEGNLGKPMPYNGVAEKMDAEWPVGNIRVFVIAHSNASAQMLFLRIAGRLDPAFDYRIVWYFDALYLLDEILKNPKITEDQKERPRKTREQIVKTMGSEDDVRSRMSKLREPMAQHIRQNYTNSDIDDVGRSIMEKGQSR